VAVHPNADHRVTHTASGRRHLGTMAVLSSAVRLRGETRHVEAFKDGLRGRERRRVRTVGLVLERSEGGLGGVGGIGRWQQRGGNQRGRVSSWWR
jgi:hypothetical protein